MRAKGSKRVNRKISGRTLRTTEWKTISMSMPLMEDLRESRRRMNASMFAKIRLMKGLPVKDAKRRQ